MARASAPPGGPGAYAERNSHRDGELGHMNTETVFPDAECFRHHEDMPDWGRLGQHVVARRTELGFRNRADFAAAVQVSSRLISDIEKGRRTNFDQVTLSALEAALGWETGSVQQVVEGGEPRLRPGATATVSATMPGLRGSVAAHAHIAGSGVSTDDIDDIDLVYASSMPVEQKLKTIRQILLLRKQRDAELAAMLEAPAPDGTEAQADQQL